MLTKGILVERKKSLAIRQFIGEGIENSSKDIVNLTVNKFGISRQAVNRHIHKLIENGMIIAEGSTRQRKYRLKPFIDERFHFTVTSDLQEDVVWRDYIRPYLNKIPQNVLNICHYGITEMVNNVIDHSGGTRMSIHLYQTKINIGFSILDNGVGIFKKIQTELGLDDPSHAILELAKGKLTTDPKHHTGEGIFFSSRMFNRFSISSRNLFFAHSEIGHDWLLGFEEENGGEKEGTFIVMEISTNSTRTAKEVFDKYSGGDDDYGFTRTIVPVVLAKYGDENLISRSQAKRLLARLDKFREVIMDFDKVEAIGRAFADEIFRVFQKKNPHIHLMYINANDEVIRSISRAIHTEEESSTSPTDPSLVT
jgi:anti-sigma regulatory factor (Ser/Thr protein kinase)